MWFPRPTAPVELDILGPGRGLSNQALFELLCDPTAVEWKEKVGVATPADGSAKTTTRLLQSGKWVFKTDVTQKTTEQTALRRQLDQLVNLGRRLDLWHPDKFWFLMQTEQAWLPVSACPRLTTVRQVDNWDLRISWWSRMIALGLEMSLKHGIGLDLNPANFGFEELVAEQLYYLDDEYYGRHDCFDIAEAVVARIPEEPQVLPEKWQQWGSQLKVILQAACQSQEDWRHFLDGLRDYPFPLALEPQRAALLKGLSGSPPPLKQASRKILQEPKLTCIFADVHGNLPALETVLQESKRLQADSYLFLGDVVSYGPFPRQCLRVLAELQDIIYLRGNHDNTSALGLPENGSNRMARTLDLWTHQQLTPADREWLLALPVEHLAAPWMSVHGAPMDPRRFYAYVYELTYKENFAYLAQQHFAVCFYGHTHVQFIYHQGADGAEQKTTPKTVALFRPNELLLINPGSVGQPRDGDPRAAFALWDRQSNVVTFHRVTYPVAVTINAIKKEGLPEDLIYRLEVGR